MNKNKTYVVIGAAAIVIFVCCIATWGFVYAKKQHVNSAIDGLLRSNTNVLLAVSVPSSDEVLAYSITRERFQDLPEWDGELFNYAIPVCQEDAIIAVNDYLDKTFVGLNRKLERIELRKFGVPTLAKTWFYDVEIECNGKKMNIIVLMDGKTVAGQKVADDIRDVRCQDELEHDEADF